MVKKSEILAKGEKESARFLGEFKERNEEQYNLNRQISEIHHILRLLHQDTEQSKTVNDMVGLVSLEEQRLNEMRGQQEDELVRIASEDVNAQVAELAAHVKDLTAREERQQTIENQLDAYLAKNVIAEAATSAATFEKDRRALLDQFN